MESVGKWAWWTGCIAWAALVNAVGHWGFHDVKEAITGHTAAAWVQAVGSILAIAGAFEIANRQSREAHQEQRNETYQRLMARAHLFVSYVSSYRKILNVHAAGDVSTKLTHLRVFADKAELVATAIRSIELEELSNPAELEAILATRGHITHMNEFLPLAASTKFPKEMIAQARRQINSIDLAVVALSQNAERARRGEPAHSYSLAELDDLFQQISLKHPCDSAIHP